MESIIFAGRRDKGNKRKVNEDNLWPESHRDSPHPYQSKESEAGLLFMVADGMGGHGAGDQASRIAVETIPKAYYAENQTEDITKRLENAIHAAHHEITAQSNTPATEKMGTTIVAVVIKAQRLWVAWVGDSRGYLLRGRDLKQLTDDHSELWEDYKKSEDKKKIWKEFHYHPRRSKLTNSLIAKRKYVEIDSISCDLQPGDKILLCSDGLSGEVFNDEIAKIMLKHQPTRAVESLITAANKPKKWPKFGEKKTISSKGGEDNITALIVQLPGGVATASAPGLLNKYRLAFVLGFFIIVGLIIAALLFLNPFAPTTPESAQATETPVPGAVAQIIATVPTPTPIVSPTSLLSNSTPLPTAASVNATLPDATSTLAAVSAPTPLPLSTPVPTPLPTTSRSNPTFPLPSTNLPLSGDDITITLTDRFPDRESISSATPSGKIFEWRTNNKYLDENEYFVLAIIPTKEGADPDYEWTKGLSYPLSRKEFLLDRGPDFNWMVLVVREMPGCQKNCQTIPDNQIITQSEQRFFTWSASTTGPDDPEPDTTDPNPEKPK